jgi:hypothetical protein
MKEVLVVVSIRDLEEIRKVIRRSRHWDRDRLAGVLEGRPIAEPKPKRERDPFRQVRQLHE